MFEFIIESLMKFGDCCLPRKFKMQYDVVEFGYVCMDHVHLSVIAKFPQE